MFVAISYFIRGADLGMFVAISDFIRGPIWVCVWPSLILLGGPIWVCVWASLISLGGPICHLLAAMRAAETLAQHNAYPRMRADMLVAGTAEASEKNRWHGNWHRHGDWYSSEGSGGKVFWEGSNCESCNFSGFSDVQKTQHFVQKCFSDIVQIHSRLVGIP